MSDQFHVECYRDGKVVEAGAFIDFRSAKKDYNAKAGMGRFDHVELVDASGNVLRSSFVEGVEHVWNRR